MFNAYKFIKNNAIFRYSKNYYAKKLDKPY